MLELALASNSPRRRELLLEAGYEFRLFPVKVSEIFSENLNPGEIVSHLATLKARAAVEHHNELKSPGFLVLGADTMVFFDGRALGKPRDALEAGEYLRLLSGNTHSVMSGFCLLETGSTKFFTAYDQTTVEFRALTEVEIAAYVASGEPMDKAGAYGIQGAAAKFVSSVRGSRSNVVGLPMERLARALEENGWNVRKRTP
jgi:septum formation protein